MSIRSKQAQYCVGLQANYSGDRETEQFEQSATKHVEKKRGEDKTRPLCMRLDPVKYNKLFDSKEI